MTFNNPPEKSGRKKLKRKLPQNFFKGIILLVLVFSFGVILGQEKVVHFNLPGNPRELVDNKNLPDKLDYAGVEEVYDELKSSFDGKLDKSKLTDGLKQGLVEASGDPYTEYMNAEESKDFQEGLTGSFEGIGAELGKEDQSIVIVSPIAGFPAEKAGLRAKDIIVEIDGASAQNLSINDAVKKIRGPKGTKVKLVVLRGDKRLDFEITRDQITIPSVTTEIVDSNIGIIKVSRFGEDTVGLVRKAAIDFKSKNVRGIVLDLRGNPGGLLDAAVGVSEVWLPQGSTILKEKRGGEVIKTFTAGNNAVLKGIKTVVLINEGSASASEIVAGALKDNKAATIIGVTSYGKGSVQEVKSLSLGGTLKVTVARWFTPNDRNIDKEGIEPDKKIELSDADIEAKKDKQRDSAVDYIKN